MTPMLYTHIQVATGHSEPVPAEFLRLVKDRTVRVCAFVPPMPTRCTAYITQEKEGWQVTAEGDGQMILEVMLRGEPLAECRPGLIEDLRGQS